MELAIDDSLKDAVAAEAEFRDILVVEDDLATTQFLKALCRRIVPNARIKSFESGEEALRYLHNLREMNFFPPDLAFVDVYLSGDTDGFSIAEYLQQSCPSTIVAMTTSMSPEVFDTISESIQLETEYIHKPYNIRDIATIVEKACLNQ